MTPIIGFAPDALITTPGVLSECVNTIPYERGMEAAPTGVTAVGVPSITGSYKGSAIALKLDGSTRFFAGNTQYVYELVAGAWVARNAVAFAASTDAPWAFTQFGDSSLFSDISEKVQRSTSGAFTQVATAPKAAILFTVNYYVIAMNIDDGTSKPNGWACCDKYDETVWTVLSSNLADSGQLLSSPGKITAGGRLGDYAIAYKAESIFVGSFVESTTQTIDFRQIPGNKAGCVGPEAWCDIGAAHFIVGMDNFWVFDGNRPISVGDADVRQWFFNNSTPSLRYKTKCIYDLQNNRVWVSFIGIGSTTNNMSLVFHVARKNWGLSTLGLAGFLNYITPTITIDGLDAYAATIDALPNIPFDSQYWLSSGRTLGYFSASGQLSLMSGPPGATGFTTGDVGDDQAVSTLTRSRLRFEPGYTPTTATATGLYKFNEGDALTIGDTTSINDGKFDLRQTGRFHRVKYDFSGYVRTQAMDVKAVASGQR